MELASRESPPEHYRMDLPALAQFSAAGEVSSLSGLDPCALLPGTVPGEAVEETEFRQGTSHLTSSPIRRGVCPTTPRTFFAMCGFRRHRNASRPQSLSVEDTVSSF